MPTYTGSFEVQRFQLEWTPAASTLIDEDVRVCTFHCIKTVGGSPVASWDPADFVAMDNAFSAWWTSAKVLCTPDISWTRLKAYRAGPNVLPPQTPTYDIVKTAQAGSGAGGLPPQVALSVTEKAGAKKNWGRFYFPALAQATGGTSICGADGRPVNEVTTILADATDALYEAARIALTPFVIYHPALAANRPTGNPPTASSLPERPAEAVTVESIQIDNVFDVIRNRRWETATLRTQRQVGT